LTLIRLMKKCSGELDDHHDKTSLWERLNSVPTTTRSSPVENAEWFNARQHVRRTTCLEVHEERNDIDFVLTKHIKILKNSRCHRDVS